MAGLLANLRFKQFKGLLVVYQLGMLMFVISNLCGSTIQITTLPLPVLSTLQAVWFMLAIFILGNILIHSSLAWSSIRYAPL